MTLGTRLFTLFCGRLVGTDGGGNRYYQEKSPRRVRPRRWVIYAGPVEASSVPNQWHGWLHHRTDEMPGAGDGGATPWQKAHLPNLTGTPDAYRPPGHPLQGGRRDPATGDYRPWQP